MTREPQDSRPLTLINAQLPGGEIGGVRIVGSRIAELQADPRPGDLIVNLSGDRLLPGLINAHDHLQLNSLPSMEPPHHYAHAQEWITEIDALRRSDPAFLAAVAVARNERLTIGAVKNLLSGVTTVAHHDRLYSDLTDPSYPIRVVAKYGWSHSLYIDGEAAVRTSYQRTPSAWPWIIHAAEGLDQAASDEFDSLDRLGCIGPNTLVVHGVALDRRQRRRLDSAGAGLIWCPSSNLRLFGKTLDVAELIERGRVAVGTDSRLSGARDLLGELRVAATVGGLDDATLEALATRHSSRLLRLADRGVLKPGARADILVLPGGIQLGAATRADVRLVLVDGNPSYGDEHYADMLTPVSAWVQIRVDDQPKVLSRPLAVLLSKLAVREQGIEIPDALERAA
jgi:cytosine/adenosine deaminase-related metal-dependent hydrolase